MKTTLFTSMLFVILVASLYSQSGSINNTLGSGGKFTIKDGSTTFLNLSQSTGYLSINYSLTLPASTGSTLGVIFKGADRFIHDYQALGTYGYNTFVGLNAGNFTMSGSTVQASFNTAVGYASLSSLTTGYQNSAFGEGSLYSTTTGYYNSAFGFESLYSNSSGSFNSTFGFHSLYSTTTGYQNSSFGHEALQYNTTGNNNSAFGFHSLRNNIGNNNTALGYLAGESITTGSNITCIGASAQPSSPVAFNEITLGNNSIITLRCWVTSITSISDARDKRNIRDLNLGLNFLMRIKPRVFNWDRRDWYENGKSDGSKMQKNPTAGFIAQELDEVQTKEGTEWLNLVLKSNPVRLEATPGNLLPIMVKAIQELKSETDALKNEVVNLRASIAEQIKKEVKIAMLKAVQQEDVKTKLSLNETKN
jgi:hypothetical protein